MVGRVLKIWVPASRFTWFICLNRESFNQSGTCNLFLKQHIIILHNFSSTTTEGAMPVLHVVRFSFKDAAGIRRLGPGPDLPPVPQAVRVLVVVL